MQKKNNSQTMADKLPNDTQLSKKLSWLLRHGAHKEGLPIRSDGFLAVAAISQHPKYSTNFSLDTLKRLVLQDVKLRYTLKYLTDTNEYVIRANQGHSIDSIESEMLLSRIQRAADVPLAVHGTYYRHWPKILSEGLRCMGRNHIHFAVTDVLANTSGFRRDSQMLIYLDVHKAMTEGGMVFFRSSNNVILSAGNGGSIAKNFFLKVVDRKTHALLKF